MKRLMLVLAGVIAGTVVIAVLATNSGKDSRIVPAALAAPYQGNACTFPTQMGPSAEQTAWQIFVAATCPGNNNQVVWENWIEQEDLYVPTPTAAATATARHRLHASPLAKRVESRRGRGKLAQPQGGAFDNCPPATNPPLNDPKRVICEEVRLNPDSMNYIKSTSNGLQFRGNQASLAKAGGPVQFPGPAVEIKADWVQVNDCNDAKLKGVHCETIDGKPYALAGMHLISKLVNNWIWATFEPQNLWTNPDRCVVLGCDDPYGAEPAHTGGPVTATQQTAALKSLMEQANLSSEWFNYRLDGTQVDFVDQSGKPTLLGNSVIEWENANVPLQQASCITCHDVSSVENNGTDGLTLLNSNPVGNPAPLPSSAWIRRDFVWSLALACPDSGGINPNCPGKSGGPLKRKK